MHLEKLEKRTLLAVITTYWNESVPSGDYSNGSNWSAGVPSNNGTDSFRAVFNGTGTRDVDVDVFATVDGIDVVGPVVQKQLGGRTANVGQLTVKKGSLTYNDGTVNSTSTTIGDDVGNDASLTFAASMGTNTEWNDSTGVEVGVTSRAIEC